MPGSKHSSSKGHGHGHGHGTSSKTYIWVCAPILTASTPAADGARRSRLPSAGDAKSHHHRKSAARIGP
ncbi:hypothetical protein Cob_v011559 [Colletotrichum orbiculare MAFF 240422]|uniref:Uncharacterized protein n=1 Tax=Colletotrichum orbiculare (strain 104-T / ATCC 96160 / CBS 514.97 / LARS 414 / MAFF 240422) TaxID=1213857 RepID=A0A484FAM1_COLOR|nr:hypothetical protein Cob_v011559 [Colletotrichum orbiculare MAFF 240422]